MSLQPTYTLTVDIATITGGDVPCVLVEVSLADPRLIYPLGTPTQTMYPTLQREQTDSAGVAQFQLLPSSLVGNYKVTIGDYSRTITMPPADARLSSLGETVDPGDLGSVSLDVRMAHLVADLSAAERQAIQEKLGGPFWAGDLPLKPSVAGRWELNIDDDGIATWVPATGGSSTGFEYFDYLFGVSDDAIPTAAELTEMSDADDDNGQATIEMYTGSKHWLLARVAGTDGFHSVKVQGDTTEQNQIGAFSVYDELIVKEGLHYQVLVSNQALQAASDVTLIAR